MPTATLTKWGNSQGLIIPKSMCDQLGISVGDKVSLEGDARHISILPEKKTFKRSRLVTIDALFEGWDGPYVPPSDFPSWGSEVDWGEPMGNEVW